MRMRLAALLLLLTAAATGVLAQGHPGNTRGYYPDKIYQFDDLDTVNIFNGGISMDLELGQSFPLDGGLAYGLTLNYNSKVWDHKDTVWQGEQYTQAIPNRRSNAGMGWLVSLGKLIPPRTPTNMTYSWEYEAPDGSTHLFHDTLHSGETVYPVCTGYAWECQDYGTVSVAYTRDSSYLRMKQRTDGTRWVEFPNGNVHVFSNFSGDWRITQIRNRLTDGWGNHTVYVNITYPTTAPAACPGASMTWELTDKHNRKQYVCFKNRNYPASIYNGHVVDRIVLQAFPTSAEPARQAIYSFEYDFGSTVNSTVTRSCTSTDPAASTEVSAPLLTKLTLPDGTTYNMTYNTGPDHVNCSMGQIASVTLPTRGKLLWTYRLYRIPTTGCGDWAWSTYSSGVATRQRVDENGNDLGTWTYETELSSWGDQIWCETEPLPQLGSQPSEQMKNTITSPRGDRVMHYFSVWPETHASQPDHGFRSSEYGLPFSRMYPEPNAVGGRTRYLSKETYPGGATTPSRSTYVAYEHEAGQNRRIVSERTIYHDDGNRSTYTDFDRFDGLGNFRRETSSGTFGSDPTRIVVTNYNPGQSDYVVNANGDPVGSYTMWPATSPWVLKTYDFKTLTEGSRTVKTQYCFDGETGLLKRLRALTGQSPAVNDVVRTFEYDVNGNLTSERDFGGDTAPLTDTTATLCDAFAQGLPATDVYRVDHTYQYGALTSTQYMRADGTAMPFYSERQDIDARTGLPSFTYDASGLWTQYLYDKMGRVESIRPQQGSRTDFVYNAASAGTPPSVDIYARTNNGGTTLTQAKLFFDNLGRVTKEHRLLPDGWAEKSTTYNTMNEKESESEWQLVSDLTSGQPVRRTFFAYDPYGRVVSETPPDGVAHRITTSYLGTRTATTTIGNTDPSAGPLGGIVTSGTSIWNLTETASSSTSTFDALGRLVSVTEPAGPNGANVTTSYTYAYEDFLSQVRTTAEGVTQTRTFNYDNRGLLTSESHPESGTTTFSQFDTRGHATRKVTPIAGLTYSYDRAERLLGISQDGVGPLKEYAYDRPGTSSDRSNGKLDYSIRHNYHPVLGGDVTVRETYTYGGVDGRVSSKQTVVSTGQTFTDGYTYNDLGAELSVTYPQCIGCGGAGPPRTVTNHYTSGLLTRVAGYTSASSLIEYHPTVMVKKITRVNADGSDGPVDTVAADPFGMPRPQSITVTRFCDNFSFNPEPADKTVTTGSPANVTVAAGGATWYQWYRGSSGDTSSVLSDQTGSTLTTTINQTSTFWVRAGNGMCTVDSRTVTVTAQACAAPNATISTVGSINAAGSASASVASQSGASYSWSISNGTITSGNGTSTITYTAGCSGNVTLSVTVTASCGTAASDTRSVVIILPTATVSGSTTIDSGQTAQLRADFTGTGPWSVTWSDGVTNTFSSTPGFRNVTPTSTTTYTITSLTGNGCAGTASGSAVVQVRPYPATNVVANANSTSQVTVTWTPSSNASYYEVYRRHDELGWQAIGTAGQSNTPSFVDFGREANKAYVYLVYAISSSGTYSYASNVDVATTIVFDDDPIVINSTLIRAQHLYQLRTAINAVRRTAGYSAATFTDASLSGVVVRTVHIQELRDALAPARSALALPAVSYADQPLTAGTPIRGTHIMQLRGGVK